MVLVKRDWWPMHISKQKYPEGKDQSTMMMRSWLNSLPAVSMGSRSNMMLLTYLVWCDGGSSMSTS